MRESNEYQAAWEITPLHQLCDVVRGVTYKKGDARESAAPGYLPILRATNIQEGNLVLDRDLVFVPKTYVSPEQQLRPGDIVVATSSGSKHLVGKSAQLHQDWGGSFGAFCSVLRPHEEENRRYLALFLRSPWYIQQIGKKSSGININNLRRDDLETIQVPLAPRELRPRIVAEIETQFSRLDEAVASLKRAQANLKRYKAAVLKAAVEGKLTEEWRAANLNVEPASELLQRILAERRHKWKGRRKYKDPIAHTYLNSPSLPKDWTWVTIEQLSTQVQYGSSAKTNEDSNGVPVLRMGNIRHGKIDFTQLKSLPKSHYEFPDLLLAKGDLLFNRTNSAELVGKTAVFKGTPQPCSFASYLIRVRLADGCVPDYINYFINSVYGRTWIANVVSQQVGQANVNGSKLQALCIPLPPLAEQVLIVADVERILSVVEELEMVVSANLGRAERLRRTILQLMFSTCQLL